MATILLRQADETPDAGVPSFSERIIPREKLQNGGASVWAAYVQVAKVRREVNRNCVLSFTNQISGGIMKAIADEETRRKLSGLLRSAVCIELAFWLNCFVIEALFDDKCDAIVRIYQVGRNYAERKIRVSEIEEIMFGLDAKKLTRTTRGRNHVSVVAQLPKDARRKLLHATQNALWLHNALLNEAESIARN